MYRNFSLASFFIKLPFFLFNLLLCLLPWKSLSITCYIFTDLGLKGRLKLFTIAYLFNLKSLSKMPFEKINVALH